MGIDSMNYLIGKDENSIWSGDARPIVKLVRGVQDDLFTIREAAEDLRFTLVALTDLDLASFCAPALDRKYTPALSLPKKSTLGNLQDFLT